MAAGVAMCTRSFIFIFNCAAQMYPMRDQGFNTKVSVKEIYICVRVYTPFLVQLFIGSPFEIFWFELLLAVHVGSVLRKMSNCCKVTLVTLPTLGIYPVSCTRLLGCIVFRPFFVWFRFPAKTFSRKRTCTRPKGGNRVNR